MKKLSICIPTYNRGEYIGDTLASVVEQMVDEIELVISDNDSTDNTAEVVNSYQSNYPNIRYIKLSKNMGADRNFLNVVAEAKGEYCWLMGSDDVIEPGSISTILKYLDCYEGATGMSVNQIMYSPDMRVRIRETHMAAGMLDEDYVFKNAESCFSQLGQYFGYLSGQIINKQLWNAVIQAESVDRYFNAFVHVYIIGRMLKRHPYWIYIHKPCIGYRSGNDSFLQEGGVYKRQVIAHANLADITRDLFGFHSFTYDSVLKIALTKYMRGDLAGMKRHGATMRLQARLFLLYCRIYWRFPYFWLYVFPIFFVPNVFVDPLANVLKRNKGKVQ